MDDRMIVRGRRVITSWTEEGETYQGDALYIADGVIVAIGDYESIRRRYPNCEVLGNGTHLIIPGFVNSHAHGRSTFFKGTADEALELRVIQHYMNYREDDPYWEVRLSSMRQLEAGITTTMHLDSYYGGSSERYESRLHRTLEAYQDSGIRFGFALGMRDQNIFFYGEERFIARLPESVRREIEAMPRLTLTLDEYVRMFDSLRSEFEESALQFAPVNPVWCSDELLVKMKIEAERRQARIQIHLLETPYQREYAFNRYGKSAVQRLDEIGFLDEGVACGHCVWVTEEDIEVLSKRNVAVVHMPGSNLRLQSGIAPVRTMEESGVKIALATDSLGLNDDEDMLQEAKLAQLLQCQPGQPAITKPMLSADRVLWWATGSGEEVVGISGIGALAPGFRADLVMVKATWLSEGMDRCEIARRMLQWIRRSSVDIVAVGGKVMVEDGKYKHTEPSEVWENVLPSHDTAPIPKCLDTIRQVAQDSYASWSIKGQPYHLLNSRRRDR